MRRRRGGGGRGEVGSGRPRHVTRAPFVSAVDRKSRCIAARRKSYSIALRPPHPTPPPAAWREIGRGGAGVCLLMRIEEGGGVGGVGEGDCNGH